MNVKKALKTWNARKDLNQAKLAKAAGITEATISKMVTDNEVNTKVLRPICKVLGISMSDFMKEGEE